MAFKFFRRRKKSVLIIMVLLMVAFLMPSLLDRLGSGSRRDMVVGYINEEEVTDSMIQASEHDLNILHRLLGLDMRITGLTWTLLLHEAGQMGITIKEDEDQVDSFLVESKLTGGTLANLRESKGYTEKRLRQAIANYLMVITAFKTAEINTIPSLPELRHTFGDIQERIQLAMVALPAENFTADAPEPTEDAVLEQFDRHRHLTAHGRDNKTAFGFGYRLADSMEVAWLFIDEESVTFAVEPPEKKMMNYWDRHRGELKKRIPIPTTSPTPAETQPTQPVEEKFREVAFESFSHAKPQIRRILMPGAIDAKMSEITSLAERTIQRFADTDNPYSEAARAMVHPAEAMLSQKVNSLPFSKGSVEAFIGELEEATKVKIVYPFGKHDKLTLDSKIEIKIKAWGEITLGEALERIGRKAEFPSITWVTCNGMDGVLFPSEPVNLVPISAGRTGMVGFEEVYRHELLGLAGIQSGAGAQSLLSIAVTAKVFQPSGKKHEAMIEPGSDFDRAMYVSGDRNGRLLWRLVKAEAHHAPLHLTAEIRKQVVGDLKTVSGFSKALAAAETLKAELEKPDADLEKLAGDKKLDFTKTNPFSRKTMQYQTGRIFWSDVPGIGADKQFIKQAFELIPSDPDEPGDDKPATVIPLRQQAKVMVIQRIGYKPVTEGDFDNWGKYVAGMSLTRLRQEWATGVWFSDQSVAKRVNYRPKHSSE